MAEPVLRRVFFALWPDAAARDALDDLAAKCAAECRGKRVVRDNLHLTLAFIGMVSSERIAVLQEAASRVRFDPCEMLLDRLGCWPRNRILWAGCSETPPAEILLFSALSRELAGAGFPIEARAHVPHVTLVRNALCERLSKHEILVPWRVDAFTLVESSLQPTGARYYVLSRWPL